MAEHRYQCPLVWRGVFAHLWLHSVCTAYVLLVLFGLDEAVRRDDGLGTRWVFPLSPCLSWVFCALGCWAAVPFLGPVIHPAELRRPIDEMYDKAFEKEKDASQEEAGEASEEEPPQADAVEVSAPQEDGPHDEAPHAAQEDGPHDEAPHAAQEDEPHDEAPQAAQEETSAQEEAAQEDASRDESAQEDAPPAEVLPISLGWFAFYYLFVTFFVVVVLNELSPFTDFATVELIEDGMIGKQAPGWASINCMMDARPESIDVRTDLYSYFVLADPQWRVASANATLIAEDTVELLAAFVAPILYNGPVKGCQTKYPLFAVCIAVTAGLTPASLPSACGWGNDTTGAWTPIRLITGSGDLPPDARKKFWEEWVPNPYNSSERVKLHHENLFEFNSFTYGDAVAYVEDTLSVYPSVRWKVIAAWYVATVPIALCICAVGALVAAQPGGEARPMLSAPDESGDEEVPTQPSELDVPPSPREEEELLALPPKDEENVQ